MNNLTFNANLPSKKIENVKYAIAIGSGKGGVGKSTVTTNLALALKEKGYKVGILDVDVYGPSIPIIMGVEKEKPLVSEDKMIIPIKKDGIKIMSIGFLIDEGVPVIWRGPLVNKLIEDFLYKVLWEELDFLLVDLPPGTGDAPLSLAQKLSLNGFIVVTTPQYVAVADVMRSVSMAQQLKVDVIGVIENMSYFICDNCGKKHYIFANEKTKKIINLYNTQLLGQIPMNPLIAKAGDEGDIKLLRENKDIKEAYDSIAKKIEEFIEKK